VSNGEGGQKKRRFVEEEEQWWYEMNMKVHSICMIQWNAEEERVRGVEAKCKRW
jgi:hypothetical protein